MLQSRFSSLLSVIICLIIASVGLQAQNYPEIQARFVNPVYNSEKGIYTLDVQLKTGEGEQYLYAFNVRFFYDGEVMKFTEFSDFADAYGILGGPTRAKAVMENTTNGIGRQYFSFSGAAGYVNTGVHLLGEEKEALKLREQEWATAFKVNFKVEKHFINSKAFCPSVVWDLKNNKNSKGGFLNGSSGFVITVLEGDPNTPQISTHTLTSSSTFNWEYSKRTDFPYGLPVAKQCISLDKNRTQLPTRQSLVGYQVLQNVPNPFDSETHIGFNIPQAKKVKLKIFDAAGRILLAKTGNYEAGYHSIRIENTEVISKASQLLFYTIETDDFVSAPFKMNRIKN